MAKTKRVRVKPREYNMIANLADKENISYSEATEKLIEQTNIIIGEEVINMENMDEEEIKEMINNLEEEKKNFKEGGENKSSGSGLIFGSIVAGLIYLLSKNKN